MTVKELIEKLQQMPHDSLIYDDECQAYVLKGVEQNEDSEINFVWKLNLDQFKERYK